MARYHRKKQPLFPTALAAELNAIGVEAGLYGSGPGFEEWVVKHTDNAISSAGLFHRVFGLLVEFSTPSLLELTRAGLAIYVYDSWISDRPAATVFGEEIYDPKQVLDKTPIELAKFLASKLSKSNEHKTEAAIARWQELGLLKGGVVWKHVVADSKQPGKIWRGNLGAPYEFGKVLEYGMACAGPFGAMRDYGSLGEGHFVMAIKGELVASFREGVFDVFGIEPVALYKILHFDRDKGELDCRLLQGEDVWPE